MTAVSAQQFSLSKLLYEATIESPAIAAKTHALRAQLADRQNSARAEPIAALVKKLADLEGPENTGRGGRGGGRGRGGAPAPVSFSSITAEFAAPLNALQESDDAPTPTSN